MSNFSRRQLLAFFGASAGTAVLAPAFGERLFSISSNFSVAEAAEPLSFTPVRLPHPLPIYQQQKSFLATGINGKGKPLNPAPGARLSKFEVIDDVVVPPEYERYVIVSWGDRVFPNKDEYFGYNNDFTGFVPLDNDANDGYLWVNHEYVSYPFTIVAPETPSPDPDDADDTAAAVTDLTRFPTTDKLVLGFSLPAVPSQPDLSPADRLAALSPQERRLVLGEFLYNMGGSILRLSKRNGEYQVVSDPKNRRLHDLSGIRINSQRTDGYQAVTSWGNKSYQKGDDNYLISTGPAATQVFQQVNSDGLGNKIIGTGHNCSGGTTPWGTILSAEENFQASSSFFVGVTESVNRNGTQTSYTAGTTGAEFGQVGEKYGWIVEIDPARPNFRPRKHTALGRFRWENITLRVESGKKLVAYMGDDRRGGHTWKFVSKDTVSDPKDKNNSRLFEEGTLYVARYNPPIAGSKPEMGTGRWIPLDLNADTNPLSPSILASVEIRELGEASRDGLFKLPRRVGIPNQTQTSEGGSLSVTLETAVDDETGAILSYGEAEALPAYRNKKLSDFYDNQGAVLVDAFLAANLIGGTPTARPEDLEINPRNKREVFISYTDGAAGSDGYPDSRIFVVAKYSGAINDAQPSGSLFKIIEDSDDSTGYTFRWQQFAKGGEAGAKPGNGFANVDNLVFDPQGNIWGVTDMSTGAHNGFEEGAAGNTIFIEHSVVGAESPSVIDSDFNVETSNLIGVFGNNWLFYIPTTGADAGRVVPFASGPVRCEMTGPTFIGKDTLILSVQHPSENCPFKEIGQPRKVLERDIEMLNLENDVSVFTQKRRVPRGSNWPSNIKGQLQGPPRPSVVGIRRKQSKGSFV